MKMPLTKDIFTSKCNLAPSLYCNKSYNPESFSHTHLFYRKYKNHPILTIDFYNIMTKFLLQHFIMSKHGQKIDITTYYHQLQSMLPQCDPLQLNYQTSQGHSDAFPQFDE